MLLLALLPPGPEGTEGPPWFPEPMAVAGGEMDEDEGPPGPVGCVPGEDDAGPEPPPPPMPMLPTAADEGGNEGCRLCTC